jgi:small subunit ribosomal protein S24e
MEIEITSQNENKLLSRNEIYFKVAHPEEKTPTREGVRAKLAEVLNAKKDDIIIDKMRSVFGQPITKGYAKIYDAIEKAGEVERDHILTRNKVVIKKGGKEDKKKAEKGEGEKKQAADTVKEEKKDEKSDKEKK